MIKNLFEASYKLSFAEKLLFRCFNGNNKKEYVSVECFSKYQSGNDANKVLKTTVDMLSERWIRLDGQQIRWIQSITYFPNAIEMEFSEAVAPFISQIKQNIETKNVPVFKKNHSIRLYELLNNEVEKGFFDLSINDLKKILKLEDKYKPFKEFKKRVIEPAIEEINQKSTLTVTYILKREGRSFETIQFSIKTDEQLDLFRLTDK